MSIRLEYCAAILAAILISCLPVQAQQVSMNVRGTISAFDGQVLSVKTSEGATVKIDVPEKARISTTKPFSLADIKPGMTLGVTTIRRADGATVAIDVRPIPPQAKKGLSAYDLAPNATMTNASLEAVVAGASGKELALDYGNGKIKVIVTDQTAMSRAAPGTAGDLKIGEAIYVFARSGDGGKLTAVRVQVSKDGVKPTQ